MLGTLILTLAVHQQQTAVELAANIFQVAGLASPAGGEYRSVTVRMPLISFGLRDVNLNAWVVSDSLTGSTQVVAWNGLAYRPVRIGEPADLASDVARKRSINDRILGTESIEYHSAFSTAGPSAAAMLSLFGRADLAEQAISSPFVMMMYVSGTDPRESAAVMADRILTDAAASRIIHAQDWDALLLARRSRRFRSTLEEVVPAPGSESRAQRLGQADKTVLDRWISNLNLRVHDKRPTLQQNQLLQIPQEKRIALLVMHLDDSTGTRMYIVGDEPPVMDSPIYRLLKEGDAGIDALIGVLDDHRMTRAVFGNSIPLAPYHFLSVAELARRMIEQSIGVQGFSLDDTKGAVEIRAFWNKVRGKPLEERWLIALEDDTLGPTAWHYAALSLSVPSWIKPSGTGTMSSAAGLPEHFTGPSIKWGDLRARSGGRVYQALEARARQLMEDGRRSSHAVHDLVIASAVWDLQRAVPMLVAEKARILSEANARADGPMPSDLVDLSEVVSPLVCAKAEGAWDGYEELVDAVEPQRPGELDGILGPLWQHPDDQVAQRIAGRIFKATSPWGAAPNTAFSIGNFHSVFMFLPAFQQGLAEGLRDKSVVAKATRVSERSIRYALPFRDSGSGGATIAADTAAVGIGEEFDLRYCDFLLEKLKVALGLNGFDMGMPIERRDEWIDRAIQLMEKENFAWPGQPLQSLFITHPVFVSRPIWPAPFSGVRPGTFIRRGGG